jgi:hypothetical protein
MTAIMLTLVSMTITPIAMDTPREFEDFESFILIIP